MTHVDLDSLAALSVDPDDATADARAHVACCPQCAALLASLTDVRRLAGAAPPLPAPARVREQVLAHALGSAAHDSPHHQVAPAVPLRRTGPTIPVWITGLAAGVALVGGLGLGRLTDGSQVPDAVDLGSGVGTVVATADLRAFDGDAARGVASALRAHDVVTLRVEARALGAEDGFHEVWLINVDQIRMVALGVLASGDEGEFEVPMGLIEQGYRVVDISVEPDDGDPTHSGVSVARGELV